MTKEKIEAIRELLTLHPNGTHVIFVNNKAEPGWTLDASILNELLDYAYLGLEYENGAGE